MPRCSANKADGSQCERIVDGRSTYCYSHDPSRKEQRRRAASKAGSTKPGSEVAELKATLKKLYDDTRSGKIPTNVGQVCATIAGVQLKVLDTELREREVRVKEVELTQIRLPEFEQLQGEVAELKEMIARKGAENGRGGRAWAG